MQISPINSNNKIDFKAKFLDTYSIRKIAEWSIEHGKYKELNNARKQIDFSAVKVRIHIDLGTNLEGYPFAIFKRYFPKVVNPIEEKDYIISKPIIYQAKEKISPEEFGYKKIIQMGYYVTRNKIFKDVVVNAPKKTDIEV